LPCQFPKNPIDVMFDYWDGSAFKFTLSKNNAIKS